MKKFKNILLAGLLALLMISCGPTTGGDDGGDDIINTDASTTLNIYGLNDFHGAFLETSSFTGLSKIGKYLMDIKEKDPENTIILNSGDMFQGSAESNLTRGEVVVDAMNIIGFDSMTIGNHEFDWGEETLKNNVGLMNFPLLACNIFKKGTTERPSYLKPYTIVKKGDFKVGIIGAVQENIGTSILKSISDNFDFLLPTTYVKKCSDILFTQEDCDAVILSTHDGGETTYKELATVSTVSNRKYVDGIFMGHDHSYKNDYFNNVPYVEGGSSGNYISKISMKVERKNGVSRVSSADGLVIKTSNQCKTESQEILDLYNDKYKEKIEEVKNEVVGYSDTVLSKAEVSRILSEGIYKYVNANQNEFNHEINFACVNGGGGIRKELPSGAITFGDIITSIPFDNFITILKLNDDQFYTYKSYYKDSSYCIDNNLDKVTKYSDGFYHIASINYVSEKLDNTEVFTSAIIYRDALISMIKAGVIEAIKKA